MVILRTIIFSILIFASGFASAQQPAKILSDALQQMEEVIKEKNANLAFWKTATATAIELARQKALTQIRPIAKKAAADKDLETANEAFLAILKINAADKQARDYFQANGQWEEVEKKLVQSTAREQSSAGARSMQMIEYEMKDGSRFKKQTDGTWARLDSTGKVEYALKEIDRNSYSVTLQQHSRHHEVHQLLPDHRLWAWNTGWKKGNRARMGAGYWVK